MFMSAVKNQSSHCSFYFIKSLNGISQTWKSGIMKKEKEKKESNSIVLAYIADGPNRSYMRTLSLNKRIEQRSRTYKTIFF